MVFASEALWFLQQRLCGYCSRGAVVVATEAPRCGGEIRVIVVLATEALWLCQQRHCGSSSRSAVVVESEKCVTTSTALWWLQKRQWCWPQRHSGGGWWLQMRQQIGQWIQQRRQQYRLQRRQSTKNSRLFNFFGIYTHKPRLHLVRLLALSVMILSDELSLRLKKK